MWQPLCVCVCVCVCVCARARTCTQVEETEKEREERLKQWEEFLEDEGTEGGVGGAREEGVGEGITDRNVSTDATCTIIVFQ